MKKNFTLLELLIVIIVIVILLSLLLPSLSKAKQKAHIVKCMSNLRQHGVAGLQYAKDKKTKLPDRYTLVNGGPATSNWTIWSGSDKYSPGDVFNTVDRPLNNYLGYKENGIETPLTLCPSNYGKELYEIIGTSYGANTTYGPGYSSNNDAYITLGVEGKTEFLSQITNAGEMVYMAEVGGNGFVNNNTGGQMHTTGSTYKWNVLFLDGRVEFLELYDNVMNSEDYSFIHPLSDQY